MTPSLLSPRSIAVIGASETPLKVGHEIFKNLSENFKGKLFAVNIKKPVILGHQSVASVKDLLEEIDLAVIVTPAATVPLILEECGAKKIKNVIVITAGFKEIGEEGKRLEEEVKQIAKKHGITIVGTNCLGLLRPSLNLNASFAKDLPPQGGIALIAQSGALAVALIDLARKLHMGFSFVVSVGNKTLMDECDYLEMAMKDPETNVIGFYLESIEHGEKFRVIAAKATGKKHIVLLKSGVSTEGKRAAASHTGALAGSDAAIDALCKQTGIHRARDSEEFLDLLAVLSTQPSLPSPDIAIVTNAGGLGILATDAAEQWQLHLPKLEKNEAALRKALPPAASVMNPIDVLGDADALRYTSAIRSAKTDPAIEGICVLLTPQVMTPVSDIARVIAAERKRVPLMPLVTCFMGGESVIEAKDILRAAQIPVFETPERAIRALAVLRERKVAGCSLAGCGIHAPETRNQPTSNFPSGLLPENLTQKLLTSYGLPTPKQGLATNEQEAIAIAGDIGFPVVCKVSAKDIIHKTDVGGIRVNIKNEDDLRAAFNGILRDVKKNAPDAKVHGVLIQKFLPVGNEFIVGALRDPSFGPMVMVGLGGIYTELFRDAAFRLAPITEEEAYDMLQSLKSWKVLLGMRGKAQSDIDALAQVLMKLSVLIIDCPQIRELDFNPVLVDEKGVTIVDAKVVVE